MDIKTPQQNLFAPPTACMHGKPGSVAKPGPGWFEWCVVAVSANARIALESWIGRRVTRMSRAMPRRRLHMPRAGSPRPTGNGWSAPRKKPRAVACRL
ncbi:VGR-related protein [Ralstonia solanacearum UW551]|uniref:VGR-related protein n=1 Tax=Ralstonia solanacearum (strain UW551) TaxID=342110 RepID=A0AB33VGX2_RALSU|nr:hypothetical protein CCY86_23735 [Ralstonia solanacearum]EAP74101.1 VGR-related protein [Ralstonia solanacearum UW551]KEI31130.1 hypothetical protein CQ06_01030 [Ralstonia solanacearum]KFX76815.1 hypothetical protein KR98_22610 [Ralstonia solanacearum]KFX81789.1 hypothetical protein KR99_21065 [Ralstonia solanacearum]